mmetsp:Transcript_26870/g.63129  ORF Transcript_26870/g.63129 Transcript_26870/m.63129 type:complete len:172 (-) Transcript_26870:176-691(-)|eukprot:CAMPEP_0197190400 /NCGR_PEP_ID=MMETSP1423-20130617/21580_1 /TAXON_ID=476441 /ORGANISM="Pseudo-nitzschia heimii, Strain UNC1101" /LENGTH=171 /DNA_ID=CAMNT_0042642773 /DNA_START=398 /DNA_END=913 /DNA_ORIENTATION=+
MSSIITKPPKELNANMIAFLPELDSDYARYPMYHKRWYQPGEKGPKGEPCFIKGEESGVKKDYAFCKNGTFGPGYYSLMTKIAYVNLYAKHDSQQPGTCGIACNSVDRKALDEHDDVRRLLFGRQMSPRPCDAAAEKRAMDEAEGMANAAYAMDNPGEVLFTKGAANITLK